MAKYKFQYDSETLSFKKVKIPFKDRIFKNLPQLASATLLGVLFFILLSLFIKSPVEKQQEDLKESKLIVLEQLNRELNKTAAILSELQKRDDNIYRQIFQAKPIPEEVRKAGFGGVDRYKKYEGLDYSPKIIATAKKIDILSKQMVVQSKSHDEIVELVKNKEKMTACIPAIQPIAIKDLTRFGSPFGLRMHPIHKYMKMHYGVDLTAPRGTKIYASGDGTVYRADFAGGYGNCVRVNHGFGYETRYAHMSKISVKAGDKVKRGDVLGEVGSTGLSTSPHLHYEVLINGKFVNPVNFYFDDLTEEEYDKMIEMSSNANTHIFEEDFE